MVYFQKIPVLIDSSIEMARLNAYDNVEFNIMTKDVINTSRGYKGKR
jgi:hypothetical protein